MYPIYPVTFLDNPNVVSGDEIVVPKPVFDRWLELFPPGAPLLARLTNPVTDTTRIVCIGGQDTVNNCIFAPPSVTEALEGEEIRIDPFQEELPSASKLYLRLIDMEPMDGIDLRQAVENHLDTYHVLALGTTLRVPVTELGDTEVAFYVEDIEPAPLVRIGGEVLLEILSTQIEPAVAEAVVTETAVAEATATETPVNTVVESLTPEQVRLKRLQFFTKNNASTPADVPSSSVKSPSGNALRISEST